MILMTSNSAVSVIPECKGNYGSAKYYYYLILVTGWGWDLVSPSPIWPREEWGLPPSLHPSQDLGRKDCAGRVEPGLCSFFQLWQPWLLLCLHGVRRWLLCAAGALVHVQQTGRKEKCPHTTLPASILAAEEANMPSLSVLCWFCWSFPQFTLSLLWPAGTTWCCWFFPSCSLLTCLISAGPHQHKRSLGLHGISILSVLVAQTPRARRGAFKHGFEWGLGPDDLPRSLPASIILWFGGPGSLPTLF